MRLRGDTARVDMDLCLDFRFSRVCGNGVGSGEMQGCAVGAEHKLLYGDVGRDLARSFACGGAIVPAGQSS